VGACSQGVRPLDDVSPEADIETELSDDFERAEAIELALVADYGREIVLAVTVAAGRVDVRTTEVVSKDVLW
jgi:hypothetical protein